MAGLNHGYNEDTMDIAFELPNDPNAPYAARQALRGLDLGLDEDCLDDVLLLTNELITNSLRHGRLGPEDSISLHIETTEANVRVRVEDPGRGPRFGPRKPSLTDPGGRGLYLVKELSSSWGVTRQGHTSVWFEIDLRARTPVAS